MGRFRFYGFITVEGGSIETKRDAIDELQVMIEDYADNNCYGNNIGIHWDKIDEL